MKENIMTMPMQEMVTKSSHSNLQGSNTTYIIQETWRSKNIQYNVIKDLQDGYLTFFEKVHKFGFLLSTEVAYSYAK